MSLDILWALRWFRQNPVFALAATFILALGIGANTAIFSVVDAVLIRPLPYPSSSRLVRIEETTKLANIGVTSAEYLAWQPRSDLFEETAAYVRDLVTVTGDGEPEQVWLTQVSSGLFHMLGIPTHIGRTPVDTEPDSVVLSDSFWRRRFGADPGIVGRGVAISGQVYRIAGVMPPEFGFPFANTQMWSPLRLTGTESRWVNVIALLKRGVSVVQATRAMEVVARRTERDQPTRKAGVQIMLSAWRESPAREHELTLILVLAAVGLVLLIACADVAGLLLSRAVHRRKEIAIRAALGAGLARIARQLLAESLLLLLLGSAAGMAMGQLLLTVLVRQLSALPLSLPHLQSVAVNYRVVLFNAVLCLLLTCLVSIAPIFMVSRTDLQAALRGGKGFSGSRCSTRLFAVLVAAETAFSFLLLAGSGVMIRSLIRLQDDDHGIRPDHVLTLRVPVGSQTSPRSSKYETKPQQVAYYRELIDRLRRVPGVRAAAVVNNLPLSGANTSTPIDLPDGRSALVVTRTISPQYFDVMGIPLISGRNFNESDQPPAPEVAIVNEYLARQLFPGRDPLGQPLPVTRAGAPPTIVVGVVKDAAQLNYEQPAKGELYRPYQQFLFGAFLSALVVRTAGEPAGLASALRREIWSVDASQPIVKVETMETVIEQSIWRPRFSAWIFSALGGLAVLLTAVGVYSVVAYTTTLRAREVGIRIALGAVPRSVLGVLVRDALMPIAAGLAISAAISVFLSSLLGSLLYKTSAVDPLVYAGAAMLLLAVGGVASARPAWRAARSDPLEALRGE